jgi:NAD(P)-dependent dehydrogenase (short-subunit alcohol dehydrogenase family)
MSIVSVVTGANSGIGRATAIHLAGQGHTVYGTVRDPDRAAKLRTMSAEAGVEVRLVSLDVADDDSVQEGFAQILDDAGHVDVLVNNAGVGGNAVAEECPASLYLDILNVNVGGAVRCCQAVLPDMRARGQGAIVNITSVAGRIAPLGQSPYVTSKWALEGFSEALAIELAPFGIRVADPLMTIRLGDTAPDFTAETTQGTILPRVEGRLLGVLFSHPKDFTPVCTTELGYVAKLKPEFAAQREGHRSLRRPGRLPLTSGRRTSPRPRARRQLPDDRRPGPHGRRPLRHDPPERQRHPHGALGVRDRPRATR